MKLTPGRHVRPISAQVSLFGIAAVVTAILMSIAFVQQNPLVPVAVTAVALARAGSLAQYPRAIRRAAGWP